MASAPRNEDAVVGRGGWQTFAVLLGLGAVDSAGYGVIVPPGPDIAHLAGLGSLAVAALIASFGLGQLVGYGLSGPLLARRSAATLLVVGFMLQGIGDLAFVFGSEWPVPIAARVLQGVGAGGVWMALCVLVLERYPEQAFPRLVALLGAYSAGAVAGPLLGSIGGIRGPFLAHFTLIVLGLFGLRLLWSPAPSVAGPAAGRMRRTWSPALLLASLSILGVAVDMATMEGALPVHLGARLSQGQIGALYGAGATLVLAGSFVGTRMTHRNALLTGLMLLSAGIGAVGATSEPAVWIAAIAVAGFGVGFGQTGSMGALLESVGESNIVLAFSVWSQFFATGYLIGPGVASAVTSLGGIAAVGLVLLSVLVSLWLGLTFHLRALRMQSA